MSTPSPSQDQINSAVRTFVATVGGALAGWAIGKGYVSQAQANAILSNQEFISAATTIVLAGAGSIGAAVVGIWGLISHRQANMVATVAALPAVSKVEMLPTKEGVDIANAVPSTPGAVVTVAGDK